MQVARILDAIGCDIWKRTAKYFSKRPTQSCINVIKMQFSIENDDSIPDFFVIFPLIIFYCEQCFASVVFKLQRFFLIVFQNPIK